MVKSTKRWFAVSAESSSSLPERLTSTGADSLRQAALAAWRSLSIIRHAAKSPSRRLPLSSTLAVAKPPVLRRRRKLRPWLLEHRMPDLVAELSAQAKALPPEERARLAEELLASLDPHEVEVEAAWDEELRRRIDEVEHGAVQLVPADQAFAQVRRALGR